MRNSVKHRIGKFLNPKLHLRVGKESNLQSRRRKSWQ
jgi:hypothetical protein